jgi:hypothetical protein
MKLTWRGACVTLSAASILLACFVVRGMLQPLPDLVRALTGGADKMHGVPVLRYLGPAMAGLVLALGSVVVSAVGAARERPRRAGWVLLLVLALLSLALAALLVYEVPRFAGLYRDLGVG